MNFLEIENKEFCKMASIRLVWGLSTGSIVGPFFSSNTCSNIYQQCIKDYLQMLN